MLGLRGAALVEDEVLTGDGGGFAADLAEEGGHLIILGLRPALEGMVMALRTLHAHAQEELRHILDLCGGFFDAFIPSNGWIRNDGAGAGEDLADELVVRRVREQIVTHPRVEGEVCGDVGGLGALVLEQCGPLVGEEVGVIGRVDECFDG